MTKASMCFLPVPSAHFLYGWNFPYSLSTVGVLNAFESVCVYPLESQGSLRIVLVLSLTLQGGTGGP